MRGTKKKVRLCAAVVLAATAGMAAPIEASAAQPGDLCRIATGAPGVVAPVFYDGDNTPPQYFLADGAYFRVEAYSGTDMYRGHGSNLPTGRIFRYWINQASCQP